MTLSDFKIENDLKFIENKLFPIDTLIMETSLILVMDILFLCLL